MKANNTRNNTQTTVTGAFTEVSTEQKNQDIQAEGQNATVFGEYTPQKSAKTVNDFPQSSFNKEMSRVEQWINEWKQGMLRIEGGRY